MKQRSDYSKEAYYSQLHRKTFFIILLGIITFILFWFTIGISKYEEMEILDVFDVFEQHLTGEILVDPLLDYVVWDNLLPRAIATIFVGGGLAVAGAVMQNLMRNPMADSYTTGISSGAGLGATIALVSGYCIIPGLTGMAALVVDSFVFSLIPAAIMIIISLKKRVTPSEFILMGVGIMYFFSAFTTVLMLASDPDNMSAAYMWNLGNMGGARWENLGLIISASLVGCILLSMMYRKLNLVSTGDNLSRSLGIDPSKVRQVGLIIISMMVSVMVCFTGTIGFVGLIAPHIVRLFAGSDTRQLIPGSFLCGALILILSDALAKFLILPIGVITSVIGGPLFLFLIVKQRKKEII